MNTGYSEILIVSDHPGLTEDLLGEIIDRALAKKGWIKSGHDQRVIISRQQYIDLATKNSAFMDYNHEVIVDPERNLPIALITKIKGVSIVVL